jgi:hypothetical protein
VTKPQPWAGCSGGPGVEVEQLEPTVVRHAHRGVDRFPSLLTRIDTSVSCSIKDSFASLDLAAHGFPVRCQSKSRNVGTPDSSPVT